MGMVIAAGDAGAGRASGVGGGGEPSEREEREEGAGVLVVDLAHVVVDVESDGAPAEEGEDARSLGCRICHLGGDGELPAESGSGRLVRLGCGCRGELAAAHRRCAEAWFSVRGSRRCEICGENAVNIPGWGGGGKEFMQRWHETAAGTDGEDSSKPCSGFCRSQTFCNLLVACLVIVFVLPWFFRSHLI
ncbi:hypothetical protein GUJ93_ZPchr0005g16314 [Zizania palustris]|uniref:RING-CH-type domain-containing protein n=1 Tax=Zizania palustris TaxID=103762 RepID=A0A8J5T3N7_ZIZPA|nr:hypothetical protein GUJ93_ZPchr0005g16314 [Zizania palustris]